MAEFTSLVGNASEDDFEDAYWLTKLANRLSGRIRRLCTLRTFYDGQEQVPTATIPSGVNLDAFAVYKRFLQLCPTNFARVIADAVSTRIRPIGFRLISDRTSRSTEADQCWYENHMDLKSRQVMHDVTVYGSGYLAVSGVYLSDSIRALSPWNTDVSENGEAAVVYSFDDLQGVERLTLFRLIRDAETNEVTEVRMRVAKRAAETRTLIDESDTDVIYEVANDPGIMVNSFSTNFTWDDEQSISSDAFWWASKCGCLPIVRIGSGSGMGQFEPHMGLIQSIDQERYQRFCIQEMQAFRQRAVKGKLPTVYKDTDPDVLSGKVNAGDRIDYSDIFAMGPAALWMLPEDCEIWESQVTDIQQLVTSTNSDIKHLAAASGTPLDILSPDVAGSASGAELKREGLLYKIRDLNARANDAFVKVLRMALTIRSGKDSSVPLERFETVWDSISSESELSMAQSAAAVNGILPVKEIMRRFLHMTEPEIDEAMQDIADSTYQNALTTATAASDAVQRISTQRFSTQTRGFARIDATGDDANALVDVDDSAEDVGGESDG